MIFKKKQMVLAALVIMLGVAGYLNYRYDKDASGRPVVADITDEPQIGETVMVSTGNVSKKKSETAEKKTETDFFAAQRIERDTARAKLREELRNTISDKSLSEQIRLKAEESLAEIAHFEENEVIAGNLLAAKGFDQTLVYITRESVSVTVKRSGLSRSDTAKIMDIIYELTQNNNIKIVEVN